MADLYMVTVEDEQDGIFWDDPDCYDSLQEAKIAAAKKKPPSGYLVGIYSCSLVGLHPPLSSQGRTDG